MYQFISGLLVMGYAVAGSFFIKYWTTTHDRLFAWFATAFWLLAAQRFALALANPLAIPSVEEHHPGFYIVRMTAFLLIIVAIAEKNYAHKRSARVAGKNAA